MVHLYAGGDTEVDEEEVVLAHLHDCSTYSIQLATPRKGVCR